MVPLTLGCSLTGAISLLPNEPFLTYQSLHNQLPGALSNIFRKTVIKYLITQASKLQYYCYYPQVKQIQRNLLLPVKA